jgi:hypothetical protein
VRENLPMQVEMGRARRLCLGKTPHTTFVSAPGGTPSQSLAPLVPQRAEPHGGKEETINCRCLIFPITSKPGIDLSLTLPHGPVWLSPYFSPPFTTIRQSKCPQIANVPSRSQQQVKTPYPLNVRLPCHWHWPAQLSKMKRLSRDSSRKGVVTA